MNSGFAGAKCRIAGLGVSLAALGAVLVPATASATVTCTYAGNVLTINIAGADFDIPSIQRNGDVIEVREMPGPAQLSCTGGTPTVLNTDTINWVETGGGASQISISVGTGLTFTPGATNETGSSDEIEISLAADGGGDTLIVNGNSNAQNYRFGENAGTLLGNLNGDEADGLDTDVTATGVEQLFVNVLGGSADTFTANGGARVPGSTAPASVEARVTGGGNDVLTGGSDPDTDLDGGDDNDTLTSGANGATLRPGPGDDTVTGGASGADVLSYLNLPSGATIDLGVATPQDSGGQGTETITGVESFSGSNGDDVVTGRAGRTSCTAEAATTLSRAALATTCSAAETAPTRSATPTRRAA